MPEPDQADRAASGLPSVDVCICTYHRPHIAQTLQAVATQVGRDAVSLRVIVADNAIEPDARTAIVACGAALGLDLIYVHAPARNISIARNACLAAARSEWIAFLDDDETPTPRWLEEMLGEAERGRWDAVLGPVIAIYPEATPPWLRDGDFHSVRPVWIRGRIETGYAGNVFLRREFVERERLRFGIEFGRTGGEDLDFMYRFTDAGGRIGYAPQAKAYDPVNPERTTLRWLLRRHFRGGQSHGVRLERAPQRRGRLLNLQIALAKSFILGVAAACQVKTVARHRFLARAVLQCGVVARLAGLSVLELY